MLPTSRSGAVVARVRDAASEGLRLEHSQLWAFESVGKQATVAALHDGVDEQPILVDDAGLDQSREVTARSTHGRICGCNVSRPLDRNDFWIRRNQELAQLTAFFTSPPILASPAAKRVERKFPTFCRAAIEEAYEYGSATS